MGVTLGGGTSWNHRQNTLASIARDESGMSLVEVIVAIAIVSIVALSSASLAINGFSVASSQERKQVAVTIASGAMEAASAQSVSTIYSGRTKAAVQAAFTANSTVPGIATLSAVSRRATRSGTPLSLSPQP